MEAMRLSLLEHDEHQRREEEKRRKEATAAESVAGAPPEAGASAGPSNSAANALENASSSATSTVQGGDSCDGSLPRSCPRTPESGQASPSSSFGTVIDNLHGVSYSNEPLSSLGRVIGVEPPSSERNVQAYVEQCDDNLFTIPQVTTSVGLLNLGWCTAMSNTASLAPIPVQMHRTEHLLMAGVFDER